MSLKDLDAAVAEPAPVVWLLGDASFLVEQGISRIVEAVLPSCGLPAFNHATYRVGDGDGIDALSTARTLPMMADKRLVVLRDIHKGSVELWQSVVDYASDPSPSTVLVLAGDKIPSSGKKGSKNWNTRVRNAVKKAGQLVSLNNKDVPPVRFVIQRAEARQKRLSRKDAELLVELVGDDLSQLAQEVEKLCLYVGDKEEIEAEDVHASGSLLAEAVVWDLTSGLASKDANMALTALHRLLEDGDAPHRLLSMVVWQYRTLLEAAEMLARGVPDRTVQKSVRGLRWGALRQLKESKHTLDAADVLARLARANRDMNSRRAGGNRVLEALVVELCTPLA